MDLTEAKERVAKIQRMAGDDESAHGHEDRLYADFVKHIFQTGNAEQSLIAAEILKTQQIEFSRWCS